MDNYINIFYNFNNNELYTIIEEIHNFFYFNKNVYFNFSACQVEVKYKNLNIIKDTTELSVKNLNVIIVDSKYICDKGYQIIQQIDELNNFNTIMIFLFPVGFNLYRNYKVVNYICGQKNNKYLILQIINTIAIKYIQLNFPNEKVFISYAREDGHEICDEIKKELNKNVGIENFVDIKDISIGELAQEKIEQECKTSYILYILTDIYETRYFCNKENCIAKLNDRPGIIYNCVKKEIPMRLPILSNYVEIIHNKNSIYYLINNICKLIIRHKVYLKNIAKENKFRVINNRLDYYALLEVDKKIIYPGAPIFDDEINIYKKFSNKLDCISYLEYFLNINGKYNNISISTSISNEEEKDFSKKLIVDSFYDLLIQCLIFSGCTIHTALDFYYNSSKSKAERIKFIGDKYSDRYLKEGKQKVLCYNYVPIAKKEMYNSNLIASNIQLFRFKFCNYFEKNKWFSNDYTNARKQMIYNSDILIIFSGKKYDDYMKSGIFEEFIYALVKKKKIIVIENFGGFAKTIIKLIKKPIIIKDLDLKKLIEENSQNIKIISKKQDIYKVIKEITMIINNF